MDDAIPDMDMLDMLDMLAVLAALAGALALAEGSAAPWKLSRLVNAALKPVALEQVGPRVVLEPVMKFTGAHWYGQLTIR